MHPGMTLEIDTRTQGRVHVHLDPVWYLERQEFFLNPGDELSIKGVFLQLEGKSKLVACELAQGIMSCTCGTLRGGPTGRPGAGADGEKTPRRKDRQDCEDLSLVPSCTWERTQLDMLAL